MDLSAAEQLVERVIPLPKQAHISALHQVPVHGVAIQAESDEPAVGTAVKVLRGALPGSAGTEAAAFVLRLSTSPTDAELCALPNPAQAYRIRPLDGEQAGLSLTGTTGVGVLYAAHTLAQMIAPVADGSAVFAIPEATVLDWPDLAERGQWGGDAAWDLPRTAPLKMNLVEVGVQPAIDDHGRLTLAPLTPLTQQTAAAHGVKALPYIPHLGDLGKYSNLFEHRPELMSTPDSSEPLPPDYKPSICFSKPASARLLVEVMREVVDTLGSQELNVWLTEEGKPCFCEQCRGQDAYVLETRLLAEAYRLMRAEYPGFHLRILLTQGSYPVNEQILAVVPPEMGVTFYSGTHTYDSSHQPMIYPVLESFARHGGWLGVYPQLDNSWRTVFPFTGPQFMRARMREFAGKGLASVTGYATPSNAFCAFNVGGLAEWGWNAEGRDEHAFARAWAIRNQMPDPEAFARWACLMGPLGWDLAGSQFPMRLFWDPARSLLDGTGCMTFGEGRLAEYRSAEHLRQNIAAARQALTLAEELADPLCVAESETVLNAHLFLQALYGVSQVLGAANPAAGRLPALAGELAALDAAGESAVQALWQWGCLAFPDTPARPFHRFEETLSVFAQVVTEAYRQAAHVGLLDPRLAYRDHTVGGWTEHDLPGGEGILRFDVTALLAGAGLYRVMFRFTGGAYGADILAASLEQEDSQGTQEVTRIEPKVWGYGINPPAPHVGRYEAWNDVLLELPAVKPGARYTLVAHLRGFPADAPPARRTSSGELDLRRAWA